MFPCHSYSHPLIEFDYNPKLQIEEYIAQEDRDVPLLLLGGSGCGKSSVLCCAASRVLAKVEQGQLSAPG